MKCPTCGHDPDDSQQKRAAVSRWSGMTKKERSAEMSRVRLKGIKKPKRVVRRSNDQAHRSDGRKSMTTPDTIESKPCPNCWASNVATNAKCGLCGFQFPMQRTGEEKSDSVQRAGSARAEDMAMLIRRLCRVVATHDANNTVRGQALDYLHRHNLGGSPLKGKAPNDQAQRPLADSDAGRKGNRE